MRIAILALLAAVGAAQEPDKKPEPKPKKQRITRGEWDYLVRTVRQSGETTIRQLSALRGAASRHLVVETAKIVDIKPADDYAKGAVHVALWSNFQNSTTAFIVKNPEAAAAKDWGRWDRLSWVCVVTARAVDRIELVPVYRNIADLNRKPNPGIDYPVHVKASWGYLEWLRQYGRLHKREAQWKALRAYANKAFPTHTHIVIVARDSRSIRVRFTDRRETAVPISDPQILEAAIVGRAVVLAIYMRPDGHDFRSFCGRRGGLRYEYQFWRFADTPAK